MTAIHYVTSGEIQLHARVLLQKIILKLLWQNNIKHVCVEKKIGHTRYSIVIMLQYRTVQY